MKLSPEDQLAELRRECEEGLVAISLQDTYAAVTKVSSIVSPFDFADGDLAAVYAVCVELTEAGLASDHNAVTAELAKRGHLKQLGYDFVVGLIGKNHAVSNATYYAEEIARLAGVRRIAQAADEILTQRFSRQVEPADLLSHFEAATQGVTSTGGTGLVSFADAVEATLAEHRAALASGNSLGLPTGFPSLDEITGGFHRGQLVLLGGRTFAGKTALALSFASYFGTKNRATLFFSLEMDQQELTERILADDCGFELKQFTQTGLRGFEIDSIADGLPTYRQWSLTLSDYPSETTRTIRAKAKLLMTKGKLDLIIVDNLQLIVPLDYRPDKRLQLTRITNELKRLAKELDCVVLLLCQLNADAIGKEPDDRHYAESKQILADADVAMLAHRNEDKPTEFLIKVTKNRRGTQGRVVLHFDGAFQRFTDPQFAESVGVPFEGTT